MSIKKLTDGEKDAIIIAVKKMIEELVDNPVIEDFNQLANLLYSYKKLTGQNYEEGIS